MTVRRRGRASGAGQRTRWALSRDPPESEPSGRRRSPSIFIGGTLAPPPSFSLRPPAARSAGPDLSAGPTARPELKAHPIPSRAFSPRRRAAAVVGAPAPAPQLHFGSQGALSPRRARAASEAVLKRASGAEADATRQRKRAGSVTRAPARALRRGAPDGGVEWAGPAPRRKIGLRILLAAPARTAKDPGPALGRAPGRHPRPARPPPRDSGLRPSPAPARPESKVGALAPRLGPAAAPSHGRGEAPRPTLQLAFQTPASLAPAPQARSPREVRESAPDSNPARRKAGSGDIPCRHRGGVVWPG